MHVLLLCLLLLWWLLLLLLEEGRIQFPCNTNAHVLRTLCNSHRLADDDLQGLLGKDRLESLCMHPLLGEQALCDFVYLFCGLLVVQLSKLLMGAIERVHPGLELGPERL